MSNNPTEHHHRLFYFLTNPTQNNSSVSSTAPIAVAIQDCCRLCCPTPPTILSEPVRCKWSSCPKSFNQAQDLAPHLFRDHVNKDRKRQPKCYWESCSETVEDLVKHLTSRHLMQLWLACRWRDCSQNFDGFEPLTDHVSKEHVGSGKSEYECDWTACDRRGRAFNQRQKIMRHIQTHTGARPYQCDVCQRRFSESNVMIQHRRVHTGERPFECEECSKTFAVSASLRIHKRVHTGEKPFACKYQDCSKRFVESSNLTKHMRVHTGERPFKCTADLCEKAFSRPDQVTRHLKTHQKIPPTSK